MLNTGDILTDTDLLQLDSQLASDHGIDWRKLVADKRRIAVESWLSVRVGKAKFPTRKHLNRAAPIALLTDPGAVSLTSALGARTTAQIPCNTIWPSLSTVLYVCSMRPFRGLFFGMTDSVNVNTMCTVDVAHWDGGRWAQFQNMEDQTRLDGQYSLAGGGRVMWSTPESWEPRTVGSGDTAVNTYAYVARVSVNSQAPTGALYQVAPIIRSRLTVPAAYYALSLLYTDSVASEQGGWKDKAEAFRKMADDELTAALADIRDEFDIDESGAVTPSEANSLPIVAVTDGWTIERG